MTWKDEVEENIKCGLVDILILQLLSAEDMYGYQIKQEISQRSGGAINIREGSLYGPLYRMLEKNFISIRKEFVGRKRFRNYYHLEDAGRQYLETARREYESIIGGADAIMKRRVMTHD